MYESQVFQEATQVTEQMRNVLETLFDLLPAGIVVSIQLEKRIPCALVRHNSVIQLEPRAARSPDVEITFFPESIRRLRVKNPQTLTSLSKELVFLWGAKLIQYKLLSSPQSFYKKGYLQVIKKLGLELKEETTKQTASMLMMATGLFSYAKQQVLELKNKYMK